VRDEAGKEYIDICMHIYVYVHTLIYINMYRVIMKMGLSLIMYISLRTNMNMYTYNHLCLYLCTHTSTGKVLSMKGRSNPGATNFSKTKKTTWLAAVPDLVPLKIFEFDHLISKPKLADNENFQDFLNPITKTESSALGDPCMRNIQVGTVIQLERKGIYIHIHTFVFIDIKLYINLYEYINHIEIDVLNIDLIIQVCIYTDLYINMYT
jgi:hypothetical protein